MVVASPRNHKLINISADALIVYQCTIFAFVGTRNQRYLHFLLERIACDLFSDQARECPELHAA